MKKVILLQTLFLSISGFIHQNDFKTYSYATGRYKRTDSLNFSVVNALNKGQKIYFSLEFYENAKWKEIDNDIFEVDPWKYHIYYLKPNEEEKFCFHLKDIDSVLFDTYRNNKYRIVLNKEASKTEVRKRIPFNFFNIER